MAAEFERPPVVMKPPNAEAARDGGLLNRPLTARRSVSLFESTLAQYVLAVVVVTAVTLAAFLFTPLVGAHATALVFLLAVVLLAVVVQRGPALVAAALSAISWEFFFLPPVFAFRVDRLEDLMLLGMYFVVALVLGQLTARIRAQEEAERRREERATALYLLTREMAEAGNLDELVQRVVSQMGAAFDSPVAMLLPSSPDVWKAHPAGTLQLTGLQITALSRKLEDHRQAAELPNRLQMEQLSYLPLGAASRPLGVIGLHLREPLTAHRQNLLEAFSQQVALAFERYRLNEISEKAKLLAESERLSKTLLDSMSHEIRTPIAAIQNATDNLAELPQFAAASLPREMIGEIAQATERLNHLVGNVLEVSRLESGNVRPRLNECDVTELVHVAVAETEKELANHKLTIHLAPGLPLVRLDFVLMQQVLTNLLSNAASHTPAGTPIELSANVENRTLVLTVSDFGPGIPVEAIGLVFNKFYRARNAPTGGTGLGLSLVKGFVEAHGGRVQAENRTGPATGAVFTVSLPLDSSKIGRDS